MEANNSGFWDVAYRDNAPALLGVLRRYVRDVSVAQDLLHEVFITAIDKYESYTGKGSFEGWLYRIAVNTALTYLRNERVETQRAADLQLIDDDDTDEESVDQVRAAIEKADFSGEELLAAIDRLPEHHKMVFNMYVMDDFSHKQIAAELNISPGTSKSHLARARKKVQKFLYEDAMNRTKKKRDRRWASGFLLLFPGKRHYIDRLYRDGLADFRIPPTGGTEFLSAALEQQTASVASTAASSMASGATQAIPSAAFWGSKLSYMAACCGTAAITGTVSWLAMGDNSPLNAPGETVTVADTLMYSPPTPIDTAFFEINVELPEDLLPDPAPFLPAVSGTPPAPPAEETAPPPVVVKKQIIQRETVVVRDTIFIIE